MSAKEPARSLDSGWRRMEASRWLVPGPAFPPVLKELRRTRAFDEKVESLIVDSHDGTNRIPDPHWCKGASHEWGSLIPTICANVSLRQSKPVIAV